MLNTIFKSELINAVKNVKNINTEFKSDLVNKCRFKQTFKHVKNV